MTTKFEQQITPVSDSQSWLIAQNFTNAVAVPFMQNLLGGLGVSLLAFIGGMVSELEPVTAGKVALIIGGIVFGLAMVVRAFRDEVRFVVAVWAERHDRATQAALRQELALALAEIERIKDMDLLSHKYAAREVAERLLLLYFAGEGTRPEREARIARRGAEKRNVKRADWEMGRALLINAGVLDEKRGMVAESHTAAVSAIARYLSVSKSYVRTADGDFAKV